MHTPAPPARGLKSRENDLASLSDDDLAERAQRCQQEQSRRLADARAAATSRERLVKGR